MTKTKHKDRPFVLLRRYKGISELPFLKELANWHFFRRYESRERREQAMEMLNRKETDWEFMEQK